MAQKISLVWFKRDLRVHDHAPLAAACAVGTPVIPLYVVEPDYWRQQFAAAATGILFMIVWLNCEMIVWVWVSL